LAVVEVRLGTGGEELSIEIVIREVVEQFSSTPLNAHT
jgi:hypothetical protein